MQEIDVLGDNRIGMVKTIQEDPENFAKVKKVLTDGIIKFVEYAIELKLTQPDVFYTLINDIIAKSHHRETTHETEAEEDNLAFQEV